MRFVLPLFIILIALPVFAQSRRGGLSGTGGGSGVACFPTVQLAEQADAFLDNNQILPNELLNRADLRVLEAWEMLETKEDEIHPAKPGQSWQEYLAETHANLHDHFPLFAYRLKETAKLMKFEDWKKVTTYKKVEDANPISPIPNNCRRIQIIVRHSEGNNALGEGPLYKEPKIEIEYIESYFDRLPLTDKAMLFSHEQIYILGQGIGHTTSDHMRHFVRLFFSKTLNLKAKNELFLIKRTTYTMKIKRQLIYYLGDYIKYFIDSAPAQKAEPFTAQHHFNTYLNFVSKKNKDMGLCIDKAKESNQDPRRCLHQVMGNTDPKNFTQEEAFLYVVAHGLEQHQLFNADYAMDPNPIRPQLFAQSMKELCRAIEDTNPFAPLISEANQYCRLFHSPTDPGK